MTASGVYAAALTPRRNGPEIDLAAMFELMDFLVGSGVAGLVLMGSTGEFPHFPIEERARLVELAVKRSRVPVLAGVGHSSLDGALALGREALDAGAAGLLLMPPYFYRYGAEEVREFYLRFADALKDVSSVCLYNIPAFTSPIPIEVATELLANGPFAGIKDSSASWEYMAALLEARAKRPFTILAGQDSLYARARQAGADGVVSGVATVAPELLVGLERTLRSGDRPAIERLDGLLQEFLARIDEFPAPLALREALALRGLRIGPPAVPPGPETARRLAEFLEWFRGWLPTVRKEAAGA